MGTVYNTNVVTDGIILYMDFGNRASYPGTGTTVTDLSGYGNDGTVVGSPTFDASLGLGAFDFDNGATKQITVGTPSILQPADAVTVAAWIRPHYAAELGAIWLTSDNGGSAGYRLIAYSSYIRFSINSYSSNAAKIPDSATTAGTWYYVAGTYDKDKASDQIKIYLNGTCDWPADTYTSAISYSSLQPFRVGGVPIHWTESYDGFVGLVQIYNRALSGSELIQNYNAMKGRFT